MYVRMDYTSRFIYRMHTRMYGPIDFLFSFWRLNWADLGIVVIWAECEKW